MNPRRCRAFLIAVTISVLLGCVASAYGSTAITGVFDSSSPTYNRVKDTFSTSAPSCGTAAEDSSNDHVRYEVFTIRAEQSLPLQAAVTAVSGRPVVDTLLSVYCGPFNPSDPAQNLIAVDDDGNGYPHASLTGRNISLEAGSTYYLVVSSYGTHSHDGEYALTLGDGTRYLHSIQDVITVLRVMAGDSPPGSALSRLSDLPDGVELTLAHSIQFLREIAGLGP